MTSNDMVDRDMESLRSAATKGSWSEVLEMYKEKRELRTIKITRIGDTALHMAVSSGYVRIVKEMVVSVCGERINEQDNDLSALSLTSVDENGNEKMLVLGAQNEKGNTPLHLAASMGNVEICKILVGANPSLIAKRNHAGETPLFLAACHGHRKAFLWLHYQYKDDKEGSPGGVSLTDIAHYIKRDNDDTILHCALEEEHIDVAVEIVLLYKKYLKEMTMMRNKNGLSPLHILAVTHSAFESTHLPSLPFIGQLFHNWTFFRVKEKKQATRKEELEQRERKPCIESIMDALLEYGSNRVDDIEGWPSLIGNFIIVLLLFFFAVIPLVPLYLAEILIHGVRNVKEEYKWALQIVEELLQHASEEVMLANSYEEDSDWIEAGSKIVDTPLMIAAKNGVTEMVEKILEYFPHTMDVVNEEGKNLVLLAAEKRQTKLYQILWGNEKLDKGVFSQVDKDGNTALHLAAKLGVNLNWQTTTMVEEFKWFEFVKRSVPSELWEKYNKDGKTAEEIFRDSYKEHMTSDRQWLNQTSQTCSVASTLVASMAFSNVAAENFDKKNVSSLLALSLSLTSTISFLAILAFRSQSLNFWRYAPFMLQIAILTMFGSIVALWISLMLHGHSLTTYAILGSPIAILTIISLPIFIGPTLMSLFTKVPPPSRNTTSAIYYQRPQKQETATDSNPQRKENATDPNPQKKENATDSNPQK